MPPTNELRAPTPPVEYATKADLHELRAELKGDLTELGLTLKLDLQTQIVQLQRAMITTLIAMTAIFGTLVTILKLFA